ncbi:MAG: hypothetical protein ACYTG2_10185 [Planctomycetota bacterium]|jgi:hypothetical protein
MRRPGLAPVLVALLACTLPLTAQQVVETGVGSGTIQFFLPGTPLGAGLQFTYVDTLTTLSFTPGSVTFMGQPVDFSGTEAAWLASSSGGRWCVPINAGPAIVDATGSTNYAGPALAGPAGKTLGGLELGPGFSATNLDVVPGSSLMDRDHIPDWNSGVVPQLNGQSVEIDVQRTFTGVAPGLLDYVMTFTVSVVPPVWADLGNALAGTHGDPSLVGQGTLIGCNPLGLTLSNALENSSTALVVGLSTLGAPFKGGVLVPSPDILLLGLPTDPAGSLTLGASWPGGIPPGFTFTFQHWITDAAGPQGLSASNAVAGTTP